MKALHDPNAGHFSNIIGAMNKKRKTKFLKYFSNDVRMELLFSILQSEGNDAVGISDVVVGLSTAPKTNSGMQLFLREMIGIGCFEVKEGVKASKKHLVLSAALRREIAEHVLDLLDHSEDQKSDNVVSMANARRQVWTEH